MQDLYEPPTMKVTNYDGEEIQWSGTEAEALAAGYNINCINCKGCQRCRDCTNCTNCTDCTSCQSCTNCIDCTYCTSCRSCTGSESCHLAHNCIICTGCVRCIRCVNCINCRNCTVCTDCNLCSDSNNISNCPTQPPVVIRTTTWNICIRADNTMQIGCKNYTLEGWLKFSDDQIARMSPGALPWWKQWKPVIEAISASRITQGVE